VAPAAPSSPRTIRFGVFELDLKAGELRKQGVKIRLQEQPFQILVMLLEHPGEIVTREEIQQKLWPADIFVDFEHGINAAVKRLREALDDSADNPRFVETLARRGYRFIAPVESPLTPRPSPPGRGWFRKAGPGEGAPLRMRWAMALVTAAIAAVLGIWIFQSGKEKPEAPLVPVPLTSYPGYEAYPSFSPDGTQVAFQWCTEEPTANCDIYVKQIGVEPPSRLTTDPAEDLSPAWSPDGQFIAFLRNLPTNRAAVILIPQRGGPERVVGEFDGVYLSSHYGRMFGSHLAWIPDSKWLALALPGAELGTQPTGLLLLNVETRETRRLTTSRDDTPAFSPDGRTLVFKRVGIADLIYLLRLTQDYQLQGGPQQLLAADESFDSNSGMAWTQDGREIVLASGNLIGTGLWRVGASASPKPRRFPFGSDDAVMPAVPRHGNRLAFVTPRRDSNIWRLDLRRPGQKPGAPARLIASTRLDGYPAYSPDGKRIAFVSGRSGTREIWVCGSDGSDPVQLGPSGGLLAWVPRWSPDGQNIAFWGLRSGEEDTIYIIRVDGGPPKQLVGRAKWPAWSGDGQSVYYSGKGGEIWKVPAAGGEAVQITRHGGDVAQESPDGKFVYYERGWPAQCSVWKVPVGGGEEVKVLEPTHPYAGWTVVKQGIYFFRPPDGRGCSDLCLYTFATGTTSKILTIERNLGYRIAVSPDERTILYGQRDQAGSDLMLVENFH